MALSSSAKPENGTSTQSEKVAEKKNFYEEEENLTKLCNFLRSKHGPPVRNAVMMDKRVLFLKGRLRVRLLPPHCSLRLVLEDGLHNIYLSYFCFTALNFATHLVNTY
jgi:hypothetical protein